MINYTKTVCVCVCVGVTGHTFEILLAKVEHDNANISTVILINYSCYNIQTSATTYKAQKRPKLYYNSVQSLYYL